MTPEDKMWLEEIIWGIHALSAENDTLKAKVAELERENEQLASQLYVPGNWKCRKCNFVEVKRSINAQTGDVGIAPQDRYVIPVCPNDGQEMTYITWREQTENIGQAVEVIGAQLRAANKELEKMRNYVVWLLPLAKGYAAQARVRNNDRVIEEIEQALGEKGEE